MVHTVDAAVTASPRMFGCAISGGDFRKSMHVQIQRDGVEMMVARGQMLLAARAAGVQCFDTMYPNIDDMEGFKAEVIQNHKMGFDGKSIVNPKQIAFVHETFAPTEKEIAYAEKLVRGCQAQADAGNGKGHHRGGSDLRCPRPHRRGDLRR